MVLLQVFLAFIGVPMIAYGGHRLFVHVTKYALSTLMIGRIRVKSHLLLKVFLFTYAFSWLMLIVEAPMFLYGSLICVLAAIIGVAGLMYLFILKDATVRDQLFSFMLAPISVRRYGMVIPFTVGLLAFPVCVFAHALMRTSNTPFFRKFKRFGIFGFVFGLVYGAFLLFGNLLVAVFKSIPNGGDSCFPNNDVDWYDFNRGYRGLKGRGHKSGPWI